MHLSDDRVTWAYPEGTARPEANPLVITPTFSDTVNPEEKQSRKIRLMAALADGLPTLPAYVFELNSMLSQSPVDLRRVSEVIRTDPSLTAQVLRLSNSAFMGFRAPITKIENAVVLVGTERLRTMVLTCSLVEYLGHRVSSEEFQAFWQHCFLTAALSERIARAIQYPQAEIAYLGGLLHDIGALPLLVVTSAESKAEKGSVSMYGWGESVEAEREQFGVDHCEIGRWIGVSWSFPPTLLEVMVKHHNPSEAMHDATLVGVVTAADQFCIRRGIKLGGTPPEPSGPANQQDEEILQTLLLHLKPGEAGKLAEMLETDFLHLIQLMEFGAAGLFGGGIPKNPFRE